MSGSNQSHVPYGYDTNTYVPSTAGTVPSTDSSQAYYGYDYNSYSYPNNMTTSGYEGYADYSAYNSSAYYYPSSGGTTTTSTSTTATVVEAPPTMINPTVSLSSTASINNKSGHNQHQQDRGMSFDGPIKDEIMSGTSEQSGVSSGNKQQSSKKKQKTIIRAAGGEVWEDPTLLEWDLSMW